jgi:hypothetical protein
MGYSPLSGAGSKEYPAIVGLFGNRPYSFLEFERYHMRAEKSSIFSYIYKIIAKKPLVLTMGSGQWNLRSKLLAPTLGPKTGIRLYPFIYAGNCAILHL